MARPRSQTRAEVPADLAGARAPMRELAEARAREARARAHRDDYIEAEGRRGVRPIDIAKALQAIADELRLDEAARRNFGVSEGSVHHALSRRGLKG